MTSWALTHDALAECKRKDFGAGKHEFADLKMLKYTALMQLYKSDDLP